MKKQLAFLVAFIVSTLALSSCIFLGPSVKGNGHVTEQNRNISGFDKIETANGLEVFLVPDTKEFVVVEADENLHESIETELKHRTLDIYTNERIRWAKSKKVYVHFIDMEGVDSSSGSMVRSQGTIRTKSIEVSASSGSQQFLEVNAGRFESRCSSGAQVYLSGKADKADIRASSGAHFKGEDFSADDCTADVSSGAHIWVGVEKDFNGEASSGGHIYYSGNPGNTIINTSSGGQISRN